MDMSPACRTEPRLAADLERRVVEVQTAASTPGSSGRSCARNSPPAKPRVCPAAVSCRSACTATGRTAYSRWPGKHEPVTRKCSPLALACFAALSISGGVPGSPSPLPVWTSGPDVSRGL